MNPRDQGYPGAYPNQPPVAPQGSQQEGYPHAPYGNPVAPAQHVATPWQQQQQHQQQQHQQQQHQQQQHQQQQHQQQQHQQQPHHQHQQQPHHQHQQQPHHQHQQPQFGASARQANAFANTEVALTAGETTKLTLAVIAFQLVLVGIFFALAFTIAPFLIELNRQFIVGVLTGPTIAFSYFMHSRATSKGSHG